MELNGIESLEERPINIIENEMKIEDKIEEVEFDGGDLEEIGVVEF